MLKDKFDTLLCLLGHAFVAIDEGKRIQNVIIVSPNGYNLTFNIVVHDEYPKIFKYADKVDFTEENFLERLPPEFYTDLDSDRLKNLFNYLKTTRNFTAISGALPHDAMFLFTDKEIVLMMCEAYDKSGIN